MVELGGSERRVARRVPVQGAVLLFNAGRAMRAKVENLSTTGALLSMSADPKSLGDVELKLGIDSGRLPARTVRVERTPRRTFVAVSFDNVDLHHRTTIDDAIDLARSNAKRRPIIVLDDNETRRSILVSHLRATGMTAFDPATPLEAFNALANAQLDGCVTLLAASFGQSVVGLRNVISETFPWAVTNVIGEDVESTVDRALASWGDTDIAQLVRALA